MIISLYYSPSQKAGQESVKPEASGSQAAIVDQLGAIYPNQDFIQEVYKDLTSAGFKVEYPVSYVIDQGHSAFFYLSLKSRPDDNVSFSLNYRF